MEIAKRSKGRPTKYNEEMQQQADSYVYDWDQFDVVPSRVGLCCFLGIAKHTSYEWAERYPDFSATLKKVETLQEMVALNKGISGEFNSTITKLVLANHGYHDKVQQDNVSSDGTMTPKGITTIDPIEAAKQYRDIMGKE